MKLIRLLAPLAIVTGSTGVIASDDLRTLVVRERATASLLDGAFSFKLLKIRGYSVDVRINGDRRLLKIGQSFSPDQADCTVVFTKISPETRIARFKTDCD